MAHQRGQSNVRVRFVETQRNVLVLNTHWVSWGQRWNEMECFENSLKSTHPHVVGSARLKQSLSALCLTPQTSLPVLRLDSSIVLDMCIAGYAHFWSKGLWQQSTKNATTKLHKTILAPLHEILSKRSNKQSLVKVLMLLCMKFLTSTKFENK